MRILQQAAFVTIAAASRRVPVSIVFFLEPCSIDATTYSIRPIAVNCDGITDQSKADCNNSAKSRLIHPLNATQAATSTRRRNRFEAREIVSLAAHETGGPGTVKRAIKARSAYFPHPFDAPTCLVRTLAQWREDHQRRRVLYKQSETLLDQIIFLS